MLPIVLEIQSGRVVLHLKIVKVLRCMARA